jgi:MFS family permease
LAAQEEGTVYDNFWLGLWVCWRYEKDTISHKLYGQTKVFLFNSAVGPLLGAAFVPLAEEFDVPLSTFISGVQGGTIAAIAIGSLLFNSLAVKYGKRPIYLATTVGLMGSCFWAAEAKSFASLVAARVVCGLCMAPMEALIPASIADIWYESISLFSLLPCTDIPTGLCMSEVSELLSST